MARMDYDMQSILDIPLWEKMQDQLPVAALLLVVGDIGRDLIPDQRATS